MTDLTDVKLFAGLPQKELQAIAKRWREVQQPAGKEVMEEGESGAGFLVILDGEAEVALPGGRIRTLRRGDYYGEMAFLEDDRRSATVPAKTDLTVLAIPRWDFKPFLADHPEVAWRLLETLSHRLREAEVHE